MYKDIFESIRNEAEKRNLRERTIQLYCSDVSYFLRWIGKNVSDLTLEDAESFLTAKRLEGRSPEMQIPLHRITDSASNGSVFPVVTEHFSASSDHAFL